MEKEKVLGKNMKSALVSANPDKSAYKRSVPHSNFGSKLKGMRDSLTREITCIPYPGKIGQQPQTLSVLRNRRNGPGEKACYSWSKNRFFFCCCLDKVDEYF